jgi:hypothetical protein
VPPFAAARLWVDFRGADGPDYERRVRQLVALKGERSQRPVRDGGLVWPPRATVRPEGHTGQPFVSAVTRRSKLRGKAFVMVSPPVRGQEPNIIQYNAEN